jgi:proline iminopeptidase
MVPPTNTDAQDLRTLYPAISAREFTLEMTDGTSIYVEECGTPTGTPVVYVHGGPGSRLEARIRQWFDPEQYRIIAFQQRGTHRCTPTAEDIHTDAGIFKGVRTKTLVDDMESIKQQLGIEKWLVFGGSWGSSLSIYYSQDYPDSCLGVVLRGIYLGTDRENEDYYNEADRLQKQSTEWKQEAFTRMIDYAKVRGLVIDDSPSFYRVYKELVVNRNDLVAARIWTAYELYVDDPKNEKMFQRVMSDELETSPDERSTAVWETLLFSSLPEEVDLLDKERLSRLTEVPFKIVQGKLDNLCHWERAHDFAEALKANGASVNFTLVETGAHTPYQADMTDELLRATDHFAQYKSFL